MWKVENVYYPPGTREAAPSSSEVRDAPEEAEAAGPEAVLAINVPEELARESEPLGAIETSEGLNPDAPQKAVKSTGGAQALHAEEPALLVEPFQAIPLGEGSEDLKVASLLSFPRKEPRLSQRNRPPRLALVLFLSRLCCRCRGCCCC